MTLQGPTARLTILVGESDQVHHRPVYTELVHRAHQAGLAGASVFRGVEGFGRSNRIHTSRLLSLSEDLPVAVVIVDREDSLREFLAQVGEIVTGGLVMLERVEVVSRADEHDADPSGQP